MKRKWIALLSVGIVAGFALALANADDSSNVATSPAENSQVQQQPGTMGGDTTIPSNQANPSAVGNDTSNTTTTQSMTTESKSEKSAMNSKTCTDENGVTLHRGEKGFKACQKKMSKAGESGTAGSYNGESSNDKMNSNPSTSSDTSSNS